jgi:hypothetical protein
VTKLEAGAAALVAAAFIATAVVYATAILADGRRWDGFS